MTNCIIVDDEPEARALISFQLSDLTGFFALAAFDNAMDAFNFLERNRVDLLFLDIQLPELSGLALLKTLKQPPPVIFTTAYREFAVEAFELDALDYLVKPVTRERFLKAISKFTQFHTTHEEPAPDDFPEAYMFLRTGNDQTKVMLRDIIYVEGWKDYVKVHTNSKAIIASERLSYMEQRLPSAKFSRIHKSFIVAVEKITRYSSDVVYIGELPLPIGRVFKSEFFKRF